MLIMSTLKKKSMVPNNLNLPNNNSSNMMINQNPPGQMIVGDNTNINNNIPVQNDPNFPGVNYNTMMNGQNNIINKTNNLIPQPNENRQNLNMNQMNNINPAPNQINNMMNIPAMANPSNIPGNNMMNLGTPNQKTPMPLNTILSNMKSPQNNNQIPQMPIMNTPQMNIERKPSSSMNINPLQPMQPNINQNQNMPNYNNPINYTNIPNQNIIQNLQQNKNIFPSNYLNQIQMQNLLSNMSPMNPMVPGAPTPNYQNIPNQISNIGLSPINPVMLNPNLNNNQFGLNQTIPPGNNIPQNISRMESGNLNNSNNFENKQQQSDKILLMNIEKVLNNINNSSAKDPRKNKKK